MTFRFQCFITYFCVYVYLCVWMCVIYFCVYVYLCVWMCGQSIPGRSWFPRPIPWSPRDWTQGVRLGAFLYPLTHACHWPFLSSFWDRALQCSPSWPGICDWDSAASVFSSVPHTRGLWFSGCHLELIHLELNKDFSSDNHRHCYWAFWPVSHPLPQIVIDSYISQAGLTLRVAQDSLELLTVLSLPSGCRDDRWVCQYIQFVWCWDQTRGLTPARQAPYQPGYTPSPACGLSLDILANVKGSLGNWEAFKCEKPGTKEACLRML